jgi:hypothetical protein
MRLYIALHTALASILFAQSAFAAENEAGNMFSAVYFAQNRDDAEIGRATYGEADDEPWI